MWPYNSVLGGIDEFRQSRLGFDILNGIDTAKLYPYTGSKKVSGREEKKDKKKTQGMRWEILARLMPVLIS